MTKTGKTALVSLGCLLVVVPEDQKASRVLRETVLRGQRPLLAPSPLTDPVLPASFGVRERSRHHAGRLPAQHGGGAL